MAVKKTAPKSTEKAEVLEAKDRKKMKVLVNHKVLKRLRERKDLEYYSQAELAKFFEAVCTAIKEETSEAGVCSVLGMGVFKKVDVEEKQSFFKMLDKTVKTKAYKRLSFKPISGMTL